MISKNDVFVSIIVPFNNGKKYLYKCLENLSKIKYENFEIILIDDFSRDNSEEIAKKYDKVKYYYTNEETIGVGNARNLGIEKASGKYIMFVDVDDTIDEHLLENLQEYMENDVEMIKYKMKKIEEGKEYLTKGEKFETTDGEDGFNKLCFNDKFLDSPCIYLIKRELLDRTNLRFEKNMYHEDFGLIPQLIINAKTFVSTPYYGYNYFQSDDSIMRNSDYSRNLKKVEDKLKYYDKVYVNLQKYELKKKTIENILIYYTNSIIASIKDLKFVDRRPFEKKIKNKGLLNNIKTRNIKQFIKKIILKNNMEIYYKIN